MCGRDDLGAHTEPVGRDAQQLRCGIEQPANADEHITQHEVDVVYGQRQREGSRESGAIGHCRADEEAEENRQARRPASLHRPAHHDAYKAFERQPPAVVWPHQHSHQEAGHARRKERDAWPAPQIENDEWRGDERHESRTDNRHVDPGQIEDDAHIREQPGSRHADGAGPGGARLIFARLSRDQ